MRKVLTATLVILLSLVFTPGCLYTQRQLKEEYQRGYEEGRREESVKYKGIDVEIAKQMITEQQQSQGRMEDVIGGRIVGVDIARVDSTGDTAIAEAIARYRDGRKVRGIMEFVYKDGYWYLVKDLHFEER